MKPGPCPDCGALSANAITAAATLNAVRIAASSWSRWQVTTNARLHPVQRVEIFSSFAGGAPLRDEFQETVYLLPSDAPDISLVSKAACNVRSEHIKITRPFFME
jgi:hypothetical protein